MQPDPTNLLYRLDITTPLIGFYDAPDPEPFQSMVDETKGGCVFDHVQEWYQGKTLHLTPEKHGCRGAGRSICGVESFPTEQLVDFLVDKEGLKASKELMLEWVKHSRPYKPIHGHILIGPLKPGQEEYLRTVTFIVNPDQMSALTTGAQYFSHPTDAPPVVSRFGSGCSLFVAFDNLDIPQALIGATDTAMRENLEPDQLLFTVTKPMFKRLCELGENSFLYKSFWTGLRKARGLPDL